MTDDQTLPAEACSVSRSEDLGQPRCPKETFVCSRIRKLAAKIEFRQHPLLPGLSAISPHASNEVRVEAPRGGKIHSRECTAWLYLSSGPDLLWRGQPHAWKKV
jgi:hypothetical protein